MNRQVLIFSLMFLGNLIFFVAYLIGIFMRQESPIKDVLVGLKEGDVVFIELKRPMEDRELSYLQDQMRRVHESAGVSAVLLTDGMRIARMQEAKK